MSVPAMSPLDKDGSVPRQPDACADVICQFGRCVLMHEEPVCDCMLGYTGETCQETINEALAVPLTLGVLTVIIFFLVLLFAVAIFRQKQKAKKRKKAAEKALLRNGDHL